MKGRYGKESRDDGGARVEMGVGELMRGLGKGG